MIQLILISIILSEPEYSLLLRAQTAHADWLKLLSEKSSSAHLLELQAQKVQTQYHLALTAIRERMAASLVNYDLHSMAVGIGLLWTVSFYTKLIYNI